MIDTHYRPTIALVPVGDPPDRSDLGPQNHDALRPGAHLDEFEIIRVLGAGGFGIVYLALDQVLLRYVAIKEYLPTALAGRVQGQMVTVRSSAQADTFALGLDSFFNEARMLASFDHPSLVKVHRFWKANGTAYMAMQYYPGQTLRDVRSAMTAPPDEAWLRSVIDPLLGALEVLHKQDVFHRDIAPDNILLLPDGRPVLLDFGSARRVIGDLTQSLTAVLKPNFSPIEQYADDAGMRQGAWTDLYALGATVNFMITGTTPVPSVMRAVRDVMPALSAPQGARLSEASDQFLASIDWLTALSPQDRPQSVGSFRLALDGEFVPPVPTPRHQAIARQGQGEFGVSGLDHAPTRIEPREVESFPATVVAAPKAVSPSAAVPAPIDKLAPVHVRGSRITGLGWAASVLGILGVGWAVITLMPSQTTKAALPVVAASAPQPVQPSVAATNSTTPQNDTQPAPSVAPTLADAAPAAPVTTAPVAKAQPTPRAPRVRPAASVDSTAKNVVAPVAVADRSLPKERTVEPVAAAQPIAARRPSDICGPLNFFVRATCYRRECQAPQWQSDPQCAEARRVQDAQQSRGQL
jgi:serine/threonine protein kinase